MSNMSDNTAATIQMQQEKLEHLAATYDGNILIYITQMDLLKKFFLKTVLVWYSVKIYFYFRLLPAVFFWKWMEWALQLLLTLKRSK